MHGIYLVIVRYAKDTCSSFSCVFCLNINDPVSGTPGVPNSLIVSLIVIHLRGFYRSSKKFHLFEDSLSVMRKQNSLHRRSPSKRVPCQCC